MKKTRLDIAYRAWQRQTKRYWALFDAYNGGEAAKKKLIAQLWKMKKTQEVFHREASKHMTKNNISG